MSLVSNIIWIVMEWSFMCNGGCNPIEAINYCVVMYGIFMIVHPSLGDLAGDPLALPNVPLYYYACCKVSHYYVHA